MRRSLAEYKAEVDRLVKGFLTPIFERHDPATGRLTHAMFTPDDVQKLTQGYACPECLAEFVTFLTRCPVCRYVRDLQLDVQKPPDGWLQHLEERETKPATPNIPRGGYDATKLVRTSKDVEVIDASKLKRRKRGR